MSNGWISMPLDALAFALKLADIQQTSAAWCDAGFENTSALISDLEVLTDEFMRRLVVEDDQIAA